MKQRQLILFSVLILSIFVLAACEELTVKPGEAVKRPTTSPTQDAVAVIDEPISDIPLCARSGQNCGIAFGNKSCCAGLTCKGKPIMATCSAPTCTPTTFCAGNYLNTTSANCTKTSTLCQYGCSNNQCNSAPSCTASSVCVNSNLLNTTFANCTGYYTNCQYGCSNGACNPPPQQNCTPSCYDSDGGMNPTVAGYTLRNTCQANFTNIETCQSGSVVNELQCMGNNPPAINSTPTPCPGNTTCQTVTINVPGIGPTPAGQCQ